MLRDDDPLLLLVIVVVFALLPPNPRHVLVPVQVPHTVAAVLLNALTFSPHFITRLIIMIITNDSDHDSDDKPRDPLAQ